MPREPLTPAVLYRACDPRSLPFDTTAELPPDGQNLERSADRSDKKPDPGGALAVARDADRDIVGQDRAVEAVLFGIGIHHEGYNMFALGPEGIGKHRTVRQLLDAQAGRDPTPPDWCYLNNFDDSQKPRALRLPAGQGVPLRKDMERLIEGLRAAIPAAFESEAYRTRRQLLLKELADREEQVFGKVRARAEERGIAVLRTPGGLAVAPIQDGEVLEPAAFEKLPDDDRHRIEADLEVLQGELQSALQGLPQWQRESWDKQKELNREVLSHAVRHLIDEMRERWAHEQGVLQHLDAIYKDLVDHVEEFGPGEGSDEDEEDDDGEDDAALQSEGQGLFRGYRVNVLIDHSGQAGAPVIYEDHPSHPNLIGRIDHQAQFGALLTDYTLIRPGALHRANGGYLILDARRVLEQPAAWEDLKRALRSRELRIETPEQSQGQPSTLSLEPQPISLQVKVVLLGDRLLYYTLAAEDPDFPALFKIAADFEEDIDRSPENDVRLARLLGKLAQKSGLRPLSREALARTLEHAARLSGDAAKLSTHLRSLMDLLCEADYLAGAAGAAVAGAAHVQQAIDAQVHRADRLRGQMLEEIRRKLVLIETRGGQVGQVNGLTVLELGGFTFGRPVRITARVRLGLGEVLDLEREVELGGPVHSKGVLILSGYLGARYAADRPLSLQASLVFEQSYEGIEGDSAQVAELVALLSAIAEAPVNQGLAVTGSVNQHGQVQAVGGVNEKIEGFFDVCRDVGLTGAQGVLIPAANVQHLMLRRDVVEACAAGRFRIYAIDTVDQALELLCGVPAGEPDGAGQFPAGSLNGRVTDKLHRLSERARSYWAAALAAAGDPHVGGILPSGPPALGRPGPGPGPGPGDDGRAR